MSVCAYMFLPIILLFFFQFGYLLLTSLSVHWTYTLQESVCCYLNPSNDISFLILYFLSSKMLFFENKKSSLLFTCWYISLLISNIDISFLNVGLVTPTSEPSVVLVLLPISSLSFQPFHSFSYHASYIYIGCQTIENKIKEALDDTIFIPSCYVFFWKHIAHYWTILVIFKAWCEAN